MSIVGAICVFSFSLGNILALAYSFDLLKYVFKNEQYKDIIKVFIVFLIVNFPSVISYYIAQVIYKELFSISQILSDELFFAIIITVFFGTGISWTKMHWNLLADIEKKVFK